MIELGVLIKRNCKLFFKDKGMFITSLITPIILLVLYATFLAKVYRDSFASAMPEGFSVPEALINGGFLYESADGTGQGDRSTKRSHHGTGKAFHPCA